MYFFVKDNNMAKATIDFMKLAKAGKVEQIKLIDMFKDIYFKTAEKEITETLDKFEGRGGDTLRDLERDDEWLAACVYALVNSSKAVDKLQRIAVTTLGDKVGEFRGRFADDLKASATYNVTHKKGVPNAIETKVKIEQSNGSPGAESIAKALFAAIHGGEFKFDVGDTEEEIILNAQPGYYEHYMESAAQTMREYFAKVTQENMGDELKLQIQDELKKYRGD